MKSFAKFVKEMINEGGVQFDPSNYSTGRWSIRDVLDLIDTNGDHIPLEELLERAEVPIEFWTVYGELRATHIFDTTEHHEQIWFVDFPLIQGLLIVAVWVKLNSACEPRIVKGYKVWYVKDPQELEYHAPMVE